MAVLIYKSSYILRILAVFLVGWVYNVLIFLFSCASLIMFHDALYLCIFIGDY